MSGAGEVLGVTAGAALALMLCVWVASLLLRDASIVDRFWGLGFVAIAWVTYATADGCDARKLLVCILVSLWGLRLSAHITWRNWGNPEDHRYQAMRRKHGDRFWLASLGTVFLLQALLMWIVSLPVQLAQVSPSPDHLTAVDWVGVAVFAVGLAFEAIGDLQLQRFKSDPANEGKVMDRGLWRYTRHPNYFGDAVVWWGLLAIALSHVQYAWTMVGPLLMTFLLVRVSGVPLLEHRLSRTHAGYREYVERTSAFVPRPPRRRR
jgi:steroid 5-alpha reductase family enzyme